MTRILFILTVFLVGSSAPVQAQYYPRESPFRTKVAYQETWGVATYEFWIDRVATDPSKYPNLTPTPWHIAGPYAQNWCWKCGGKTTWGEKAADKVEGARLAKDIYYVPLTDTVTFIPMGVIIQGALPDRSEQRRSWRTSSRDSVVLTLRDGRRVVSAPPRDLPVPDGSTEAERNCWSLKVALRGRVLNTQAELRILAKVEKEKYPFKPWANEFLIEFPNGGKHFKPDDITAAYVVAWGQRIDLLPRSVTSAVPRRDSPSVASNR